MYTLIAGTQNVSSWSLRPYLALLATGAPFTMEVIRLRQGDASKQAILAHSPAGKVPVLKFEDQVLWDSLAICETLAERHSEAKLWPADPKARALARSYACEMHSGFPDLRDQLSMDFGRRLETPDLRDTTKAQIARIIAAWEDALNTHGKDGGFLFGNFTIADCMYAPVVSRFTTFGIAVPDTVKAYMEKIWALPGMVAWMVASQKEIEHALA
jgi:glutathione S-transferase